MIPFRDSDEAKARRATLLARRISQADEARAAMADYQRIQQATIERTSKLRLLRLAQQPKPIAAKPTKAKRKSKAA
jgi:hypothetical protein